MKGAICLLLSEHRTMVFRSYSSADYELIRIDFSSDEKANPGELVCKVPIPSLVAGPLLAEDFGFKIPFNFNFQASWMQNNVQKDLFSSCSARPPKVVLLQLGK